MGYKVELYDIEEDDYLVQYQYTISKNSQYLGVMLYTTTDTLDFLDYDYPNKYEATIEISGADIWDTGDPSLNCIAFVFGKSAVK